MASDPASARWRKTGILAVMFLLLGALVSFALPRFGQDLEGAAVVGLPVEVFLTALAAPVLLIGLVFVFCDCQSRIDRAHGFSNDA